MDQPPTDRFAGARLQEASFPDDDGSPDPGVDAALATWATGRRDSAPVLGALAASRLLVPVVAVADEPGHEGSEMAAVLMQGRDGRMALLAFTGTDRLAAWNPDARPVAVPARVAAQAALQEDAAALVVDVGGPVTFAVEDEDLTGLAAGWRLVDVDDRSGWLRPG